MAGNEPTKIPPHGENVFHWERTEIEEAFKPLDPKDAHNSAMTYSNVATQWEQGLETFARSVQGSIAEAWEGASADSAKNAINRYVTSAHELTPLITQLSNDMQAAAEGVRSVANGIPEANHHSWTTHVWPPRAAEEENTRNEATESARTAMLTNYVNKFAEFDGRVPVLPTALDPSSPLDISGPIKSGGEIPESKIQGKDAGKNGDEAPSKDDSDKTEEKPTDDTKPTETDPADTTSNSTSPSSTTSTAPTTTSPDTSTSTMPSSTTSPSSAHTGTGGSAGSPGTSATPSPGRTVAGTPGSTGTSSPAAAAATTSTGSRGMSGMGGMGGGAGKGKSDDESTHQIPDYLINAANTEELLGEIAPTVPGGVIGDDPAPPPPART